MHRHPPCRSHRTERHMQPTLRLVADRRSECDCEANSADRDTVSCARTCRGAAQRATSARAVPTGAASPGFTPSGSASPDSGTSDAVLRGAASLGTASLGAALAFVSHPRGSTDRATCRRVQRRRAGRCPTESDPSGERGAVTAEYAIVIMAAVAFAGLLVAIMRSDEVRAMLVKLVENALGTGS